MQIFRTDVFPRRLSLKIFHYLLIFLSFPDSGFFILRLPMNEYNFRVSEGTRPPGLINQIYAIRVGLLTEKIYMTFEKPACVRA